jgi:hypothetical protein
MERLSRVRRALWPNDLEFGMDGIPIENETQVRFEQII